MSPERREKLVAALRERILPAPRPEARGASTPLRLNPSPEQVAGVLYRRPGFVWLDGGAGGHRLYARPRASLQIRGALVRFKGQKGRLLARGFDLLEAALVAWGDEGGAGFGKKAFLVGYLGYELGGELERLPDPPKDDLILPDLSLALYDRALHWDGQGWTLESTDAWREESEADPVIEAEKILKAAAKAMPPEVPSGSLATGPVISRPNRVGFETAVRQSVERIGRGEIYQVNLCRRLEAELPAASLWPFYLRLRAASPASHGAYLSLGSNRAVMSVSPELFLSLRDGVAESKPIKGTRPRGADARDDRALARELSESAKDRAELAMIVDVTRNDLGRVCATGTVEVVRHAEVVTLPTLHHTVSTVRGRLRPDAGAVDLLRASYPAASITGAPKIQAMAVAAAVEERRRGPSMGAFGWISLAGDLELAVAIRTAVAARGKVVYHAGCGIVADSDPELEFEESAVKARAFLTALGAQENT